MVIQTKKLSHMIKHLRLHHRGGLDIAPACRHQLLLLFFIFTSGIAFSQISMVKDINGGTSELTGQFENLTTSGGLTYFVKDSMLWVTSGNTLHTMPVIEGYEGFTKIHQLTPAGNDRIFFVADHPGTGSHLWVSNGYAEGTYMVSMNLPGSPSPSSLTMIGDVLYFAATDGVTGRELWKTNGMISQTVRVKDILRGSGGSNPMDLENVNGVLFFTANDGTTGYELWKSDGTDAGTVLVKDVRPGLKLSSTPKELTNVSGTLYFTAYHETYGRELWKSNGTATGTVLVKDIRPGSAESLPDHLTALGSTLYFGANNGTNGRELWKSNGTATGTLLVKDINPGSVSYSGGGFPHLSHFTAYNGLMYFMTYTDRPRIWRTDGTTAGTFPISPLNRHFIEIDPNLTVFAGSLYYVSNGYQGESNGFMELWKTDGTEGNHQLVRSDLGRYGNNQMELTAGQTLMYFVTWEDFSGSIEKIWSTDGTTENTWPVGYGVAYGSSYPSNLTTVNNTFYFSADNGDEYGLFRSDGTAEGTQLFQPFGTATLKSFFGSNGVLYFVEDRNSGQNEQILWRSDGTAIGTYPLIVLNYTSLPVNYMATANGMVYVATQNRLIGTNGTQGGTVPLRTFPYDIGWMADAGEELVFAANDGSKGYELWKSNGTAAGTVLLRDIWPGSSSSLFATASEVNKAAVTMNGVVYFLGNAGGDSNMELWRTDGTSAGTRMVKNDETGKPFNPMNHLAVANNAVYVFTLDYSEEEDLSSHGLWKSDGTAAGITMIKRFPFGPVYGEPDISMFSDASKLYFILSSGFAETFLWASDGTTIGTELLWEFGPIATIHPTYYTINGDKFYISGGHEFESFIIRSNGEKCGTFSVPLPWDEAGQTTHVYLTTLNNVLYFPAFDGNTGMELWRYIDNVAPCTDSDATIQARQIADEAIITEEAVDVSTYPNPFAKEFSITIRGKAESKYTLAVTTLNGTVVERSDDLTFNETYVLGSNWTPGIYLLNIQTEKGRMIRKVIKNK
jgi:ELWxxDGT repeat protein